MSPKRPGTSIAGPERVAPVIWVLCVLVLIALPVYSLVSRSLVEPDGSIGPGNYLEVLSRPEILTAIRNSFIVGIGSTIGTVVIALPFAFFVSRTDLPGRRFFRSVAVLTFAAPGFIAAMGWILLLGPRGGLLNEYIITRLGLPAFNIFSPAGIIFMLSFFLYPLVFLPVTDALDNMDSRLEEAAQAAGASPLTVARRITMPILTPSILSGALLVFVSAFVIFGPVAILGGPVGFNTIPTAMYRMMTFPPRIELAAVLGLPVLAVLGLVLWVQRWVYGRRRYTTVSGKPGQRRIIALGPWKLPALLGGLAVLLISVILPFGVLLLTSFRKAIGRPLAWEDLVLTDNYRALVDHPDILRSFANSLMVALVATLGGIAVAVLAAWLQHRSRFRARGMVQPTMLSPLAFPGAILGIAMVIGFAGPPLLMGGTLAILIVAYIIRVLPQSFNYVEAGFRQLGMETEEAARSLGAGWMTIMRRITLPLLRGQILSIGVLSFVLLFRELDISVFLFSGRNPVAPVVLYNFASESQFQLMGALSVVMLLINLGVVVVARRLLGIRVQ